VVPIGTLVNRKAILKPTVLLIEDSQVQKLAIEKILIAGGYLVLLAADGDEGLSLAREAKPDLMLLDLILPKLSGWDVLQLMKGDPATAAIPVIVLSSLSQENEADMKRQGAIAYFEKSRLAKGVRGETQLIELIEETLRQMRGARMMAARARATSSY
jgi:CheY-like chemotaxis protein